jgi:hypothetical protein
MKEEDEKEQRRQALVASTPNTQVDASGEVRHPNPSVDLSQIYGGVDGFI